MTLLTKHVTLHHLVRVIALYMPSVRMREGLALTESYQAECAVFSRLSQSKALQR